MQKDTKDCIHKRAWMKFVTGGIPQLVLGEEQLKTTGELKRRS